MAWLYFSEQMTQCLPALFNFYLKRSEMTTEMGRGEKDWQYDLSMTTQPIM